ncbi:sulfite exporter TauE/SafE family protein [Chloroflexota bacterium]
MADMAVAHIIILLGTGAFAGFAGGLLGLGGAFIMTPVQYAIYLNMGLAEGMAIRLAFGTSLMVILPTVISGAWRYRKQGEVKWKAAFVLGSCSAVAALGGATLASNLPDMVLRIVFGIIALGMAVSMLATKPLPATAEPRSNYWPLILWAVPIGLLTGMTGVGGVMMVPILILTMKLRMHNAVATSLAAIALTSIGGITGYIVNGLGTPDLPDYSIGYVYLPSWFLLAVTSIVMAQLGAMTAHKLPGKQLKYLFVIVLLFVGLMMLGLFDWLGWPI